MDRRRTKGCGGAIAIALAGALPSIAAATGAGAVFPVALEGDAAPGTDRSFQRFDRPAPAYGGLVAFTGDLDGATDRDDVVYLGGVLVAREGDPAPGTPAGRYDDFPAFDGDEQAQRTGGGVVFLADLLDVDPGTEQAIYVAGTSGVAVLVARSGEPSFLVPGRDWAGFSQPGLLPGGAVGFVGDLDGSTADDSVLVLGGATVLREGEAVPGLDGVTIDGGFEEVQWLADGSIVLELNTSLPSAIDRLLVRLVPGAGVEVLAGEGDPVPTGTTVETLGTFLEAAAAPGGAWAARVTLPEASPTGDVAVIGPMGTIDHEGRGVPERAGTTLGEPFAVAVAADGTIVYAADLVSSTSGGGQGIFMDGMLVVATGDPAPGLPDGTAFTAFGIEDLSVTADGIALFTASYGGAESGDGIFAFALRGCPGDLDGSGTVDADDLLVVLGAWGVCPGCPADLDGDGEVGFPDIVRLITDWGACADG